MIDLTGRLYRGLLPTALAYPCALAGHIPIPLACTRKLWGAAGYCTPRERQGRPVANARVWDHCHAHGLIRGAVCAYHNGILRKFDRSEPRYWDDPALIAYARRCPYCAARKIASSKEAVNA